MHSLSPSSFFSEDQRIWMKLMSLKGRDCVNKKIIQNLSLSLSRQQQIKSQVTRVLNNSGTAARGKLQKIKSTNFFSVHTTGRLIFHGRPEHVAVSHFCYGFHGSSNIDFFSFQETAERRAETRCVWCIIDRQTDIYCGEFICFVYVVVRLEKNKTAGESGRRDTALLVKS